MSANIDNKRQLVFAFLEFLQTTIDDGSVKPDEAESLSVATQCISEVFGVDINDETHKKELSIKPANLSQIFNVFLKTQKQSKPAEATSTRSTTVSEQDKEKAEAFKKAGNTKVAERNYAEAVKLYTQAIELDSNNAVYYANRAAAYSQINDHENAIADSIKSSEINPDYGKAYSRLGHAYFSKGDYTKAFDAYKIAVEKEPNNANIRAALSQCEKLKSKSSNSVAETPREAPRPSPAGNGMPDLGGFDMSSLMNNPALMNMAQQFMQSGMMNDMMKDPSKMQEMYQNLMGGAGGAGGDGSNPLANLMNNPALANMAQQFAKNQGKNNDSGNQ